MRVNNYFGGEEMDDTELDLVFLETEGERNNPVPYEGSELCKQWHNKTIAYGQAMIALIDEQNELINEFREFAKKSCNGFGKKRKKKIIIRLKIIEKQLAEIATKYCTQ
jgi:hypothetical protein